MKKLICFLLPGWATKHTGGAELQCYMLSEELIKRGWRIDVITDSKSKFDYSKSKYFNPRIQYFYLKRSKSKIITALKVLIMLFQTKSYYYYNRTDARTMRGACWVYCILLKKKMIYALSGDDEIRFNSYFKHYRNRRLSFKNILRLVDVYVFDSLIGRNSYKLDLIISQTEYQKKKLKIHTGLESTVIPNSKNFSATIIDYHKENIILWVGNLRAIKRPELFLSIVDTIKLTNWKFVMIGKAYEYIEEIKKLDNNNFQYLGELSYEETNKWFEKAKVLVNTSLSEGFSNTFIQAWHFKTLILSLSVDPDNLLSQKKYGIYANNDYEQLKQEIISVANNYDDYHAMLDQAYAFASAEFELRRNVDKLESLLFCEINSNKKGKLEN